MSDEPRCPRCDAPRADMCICKQNRTDNGTDRLQEIRARLDAASRYPWMNDEGWIVCGGTTRYYVTGYTTLEGDADLIAHAPADIAWLLDEVERLRAAGEVDAGITAAREKIHKKPYSMNVTWVNDGRKY